MTDSTLHSLLAKQLKTLIEEETNFIANMSNAAALLYESLPDINWAGFYLYEKQTNQLVLGPFQGKVACVRIDIGKGVCGTSFKNNETILVPDVLDFPGHIFCDSSSRSEIVLPLMSEKGLIGVLDIDAPILNRFTDEDRVLLEEFRDVLMKNHPFPEKVDFYTN